MKRADKRTVLITGGAGFIGSNLAAELLTTNSAHVHIYDSLVRPGVELNLAWLKGIASSGALTIIKGDVRDPVELRRAAADATEIYHFAAQVAVTTSLTDPVADCETNVLGTLNVLEAARRSSRKPFLLFTSTNKVYGSLPGLGLSREQTRYSFADPAIKGIDEQWPLDFHSPYGCSKGAADQYVHDYARIYGIPTVVFRMSCIAGPRQFGTEDQGWVAHFLYSALKHQPITIYGDGRQVRDVLHVHDLIEAMRLVRERQHLTAGRIYNVGGGGAQALSVIEALVRIERLTGSRIIRTSAETRPGDQQIYITDYGRLAADTGWYPTRGVATILDDIHTFWRSDLRAHREELMETGRVA